MSGVDMVSKAEAYYAKFQEFKNYAEVNGSPGAWAEFLSIIDPSMHGCADLIGFQNKALVALLRR